MLLSCFDELLRMADWPWDYVLNLSESDYPVKPVGELATFLSLRRGRNFVKSHGRETSVFVRKQGLDRAFLQCDDHMWRLGPRSPPEGVQMDGGSDWVCLHRDFAGYALNGNDALISGLRSFFANSLLPAESFFHVALRNSRFCPTVVNNNLRLTNWRRKQGCKCQHKAVVDWCGCSPNDFTPADWAKLEGTGGKDIFFARKFEASVSQSALDAVDEGLLGVPAGDLTASLDFWESLYHNEDAREPRPQMLTLSAAFAMRHLDSLAGSGKWTLRKVLEVTAHHREDSLKHILVDYEAVGESGRAWNVQARISPMTNATLFDADLGGGRDLKLALGSDFDPKELLFRERLYALGPHSPPPVVHYRLQLADQPLSLSLALYDPLGRLRWGKEELFTNSTLNDAFKPELGEGALMPGVWTLVAADAERQSLLGKARILVTPLLQSPALPDEDEVAQINSEGLQAPLVRVELPPTGLAAQLFYQEDKDQTLRWKAERRAALKGQQLVDLVKTLSVDFFAVLDGCIMADEPAHGMEPCWSSEWSSYAPDPKSSLT